MGKYKYELTATIPVVQYGNIQPTIHGDSMDKLEKEMQGLWEKYSDRPLTINAGDDFGTDVTSNLKLIAKQGKITYNDNQHAYYYKGDKMLGASSFQEKYSEPFNKEIIAPATAKKYGVPVDQVLAMWDLKSESAKQFGNAVHNAMELYGKYKGAYEKYLIDHPTLQPIVLDFYKGREEEQALYEEVVWNTDKMLAGTIDRLLVVDMAKKIVRVQDFKTNADINKRQSISEPFKAVDQTKLGSYTLQLSYYAYILELAGYTVEGIDIFYLEKGKWKTHSQKQLDISKEIK